MAANILSVGHFLPAIDDRFGTPRPIATEPVGPSALAAQAATTALERAGLSAADVQMLIFATATPDVTFPGAGVYLQEKLGCGTIGALDVRAQCSGFLYALSVADHFVRTGDAANVLVAGAEVHSSGLDDSPEGRPTSQLFADGAGVAVVGRGAGHEILAVDLAAEGSRHRQFWCEYPASRQFPHRMTEENLAQGGHFPRIDVAALRASDPDAIAGSIRRVLDRSGLSLGDIDRFIVAHLLPEVAEAALARLDVEPARASLPSQRHGHIMAGSLPIGLSEDLAEGRIGAGATVCLATAGAGHTSAAAILRCGQPAKS